MTSKDRLLGALAGQPTDRPAVIVPYQGIFLRDHWAQVTDQPWWVIHGLDVEAYARAVADMDRALDGDWLPAFMVPPLDVRKRHTIETEGEQTYLVERGNGRRQRIERSHGGTGVWQGRHASASEAADRLEAIRAEHILSDGSQDLGRLIVERFGDTRAIFAAVGTPLWATHSLLGFQGMMCALCDDPKGMHLLLERVTRNTLERLRVHAELGCHCVWLEDCFTSADLISLAQFREFALPGLKALIEETWRLGMLPSTTSAAT